MTLPDDVTRCRGEWNLPRGSLLCKLRDECARYTLRETGGERTPHSACLCPGLDEYYQHFIQVEVAA